MGDTKTVPWRLMKRIQRNKKPAFRWILVLLLALLALGGAGCFSGPDVAETVRPTEAERRKAEEKVRIAAEALRRGDQKVAQDCADEAVQMRGGTSGAEAVVGKQLVENGVPAFAAKRLAEATANAELAQDPLLWASLAMAYGAAGDTQRAGPAEAEAEYRAKVILESAESLPTSTAGEPSPETVKVVQRLLQTGSFYSDIKNDGEKAIATYRQAHRLMPQSALTLNALGYTLADKGKTQKDYEEAIELTLRALEKEPEHGLIIDSYGWALYRMKDVRGARRALRDAVEREPDVAELRYHLGVVLAELGEIREAEIEFDRALRLRPDYHDAQEAKAKLEADKRNGQTGTDNKQ